MKRNGSMKNEFLMYCGIGALLLFTACSQEEELYYQFRSFPYSVWDAQEEIRFEVPLHSVQEHYDVYLEVRNTTGYNFRNIWLIVDFLNTDGTLQTDTIQANLADIDGKWYGSGISMYDTEIPFQTNIQYPDSGICVYTIRQGMQENPLRGIADVGLRITQSPQIQ
ncbi:MAG: gliding motility lipoprotein GldH [Candidatus Symbiothrix sp.]|jgi:gliding motility-associated lipoprotein GldH|nr:gliding motility lipoprotein GldH [Candidatus Symbiothrix sp.]